MTRRKQMKGEGNQNQTANRPTSYEKQESRLATLEVGENQSNSIITDEQVKG